MILVSCDKNLSEGRMSEKPSRAQGSLRHRCDPSVPGWHYASPCRQHRIAS